MARCAPALAPLLSFCVGVGLGYWVQTRRLG